MNDIEIRINSLADIQNAAKQFVDNVLGRQGNSAKVYALYGKMGSGKTTFIKAICEELGVGDVITSPTFAIVNEYEIADPRHPELGFSLNDLVYHFDFYRIKKVEEVYDMGYEEYFYSGVLCFIEWPELIDDLLPDDAVKVFVDETPDGGRTVSVRMS